MATSGGSGIGRTYLSVHSIQLHTNQFQGHCFLLARASIGYICCQLPKRAFFCDVTLDSGQRYAEYPDM